RQVADDPFLGDRFAADRDGPRHPDAPSFPGTLDLTGPVEPQVGIAPVAGIGRLLEIEAIRAGATDLAGVGASFPDDADAQGAAGLLTDEDPAVVVAVERHRHRGVRVRRLDEDPRARVVAELEVGRRPRDRRFDALR